MKYIVFASCIHIDTLSQDGADDFLEVEPDFCCMTIDDEKDYLKALKKVERYGSFSFISKNKFNKIEGQSDPI